MAVSSKLLAESALIAFPTVFVCRLALQPLEHEMVAGRHGRVTIAGLLRRARARAVAAGSPVLPVALLIVGTNGIIAMLLPYCAESFPLRVRGRATGWVAACTKAGGVVAQVLVDHGARAAAGGRRDRSWCRPRSPSSWSLVRQGDPRPRPARARSRWPRIRGNRAVDGGGAPIRVGLVGYGNAGATFHAPLIRACPRMELTAVQTSREAPTRVGSFDELIDRSDLVVVASPNQTHFAFATAALEAGKHVVVDKPFTVTLDEADELIALAARAAARAHRVPQPALGRRFPDSARDPARGSAR